MEESREPQFHCSLTGEILDDPVWGADGRAYERHALEAFLAATGQLPLTEGQREGLLKAMPHLKDRAKIFPELVEKAHFVLTERPIVPDEKSAKSLDDVSRGILAELTPQLQNAIWTREELEAELNGFATAQGTKFGKLAGPLRAVLSGRAVTPSVFDMMIILGREETLARLKDVTG